MSTSKHTIISFVLIVPLVVCGLMLVSSQHKYRILFNELEKEQVLSKQMDVEYSQLEFQQSLLSKQMRVAAKASEALNMGPVTPNRIDYVSLTPQ